MPVVRALLAALTLLLGIATPAAAQLEVPLRTSLPWRTLETAHFAFHYPAELEAWAREQAERMEGVRTRVGALTGSTPRDRVHVLIEDPTGDANGSAYPFLRSPGLFLWPTPPDPRSVIGEHRDWAELLLVHEYAHLAHLARPSRNPRQRLLSAVSPLNLGPIPVRTPRWVWEGYATYVEGRVTGSGRPHGVWRPAILRQWALEGRLPTYAQLNATGGFYGGSFAYLAGSAYLEWLVTRHAGARGDSVLPHLWRRLTARTSRSFDAAFAGVFPGTPAELYARWSAEVTAEAVDAERRLRAAGLVEGRVVQRMGGATGDPAVSRDGRRLAVSVRPVVGPRRIVVLHTDSVVSDSARVRADARRLARDPEDVAATPYLPRPLRTIATLPAVNGRAFDAPRFLADGERVLVVRAEPLPSGVSRPDLWIWTVRTGALRRVTRGAGVRDADPAPDGRSALGTRCAAGRCDVVRIDLATGRLATVLAGDARVTYRRPRWSPDGASFVAIAHRDGRWRPVIAAPDGASRREIDLGDGADRYDASFLADGAQLVVVSERGGAPNLELLDPATGTARALTRTTGAAVAPERVGATASLVFLTLRSGGYDLRRLPLDRVPATLAAVPLTTAAIDTTGLTGAAAPAVLERPTESASAIATAAVARPRGYGIGPRHQVLLINSATAADGGTVLGTLYSADPAGRLTWLLQGAAGEARTWRGGSLTVTSRRLWPSVDGQLFGVAHRYAFRADSVTRDTEYHGAMVATGLTVPFSAGGMTLRVGGSTGQLESRSDRASTRTLAFASGAVSAIRGRGERTVSVAIGGQATSGRLHDSTFTRTTGTATVEVRSRQVRVRADYVRVTTGRDTPTFETPSVGGPESPLVDGALLSQRIPQPALTTGFLSGRTVETVRLSLPARISPYLFAARDASRNAGWYRLAGAETSIATFAVPFARAPGVRALAGAAYTLDAPMRHRWRGYFTLTLRP